MVTLLPGVPYHIWAVLVFAAISILLYRGFYADLERMITILVAGFSLVVIGSVVAMQATPYAVGGDEILSGIRFALPRTGRSWPWAVMGSVGATAVELFMYPYWVREKGYADFVGAP